MRASDSAPIRVLIVEDDEDDFILARDLLEEVADARYEIGWASTYEAGLQAIRNCEHDVFVVDYVLGQHNGLDLLRAMREAQCDAAFILLTGNESRELDVQAAFGGAYGLLLKKHINAPLLGRSIRYALENKRVQTELRRRAAEQNLLAKLSTRFADASASRLDEEINAALQAMGEFLKIGRCAVFQFSGAGIASSGAMSNTHEWCAPHIVPQKLSLQNLPLQHFPLMVQTMARRENVVIADVPALSAAEKAEQAEFQAQEIRALACVPISHDEAICGFVCVRGESAAHSWDESTLMLLKMAGEIIAAAIHRVRDEEDLQRATRENERLGQESRAALQHANQELEARVQERTADLQRANDALRESEDRYRTLARNFPNGALFLFDRECRYQIVGGSVLDEMGYCIEEMEGRTMEDVLPPSLATRLAPVYASVLEGEMHHFDLESDERIFVVHALPLRNEAGEVYAGMIATIEITDRKRAELEMRAAKSEAERANRAKSEFLSRMSHELRTPLNSILGFGQLLERSELSAKQKERAGLIVSAGRHLLELINEVLDIASIEAGHLTLSLEPVRAGEAVSEVVSLMQPRAERRAIQIHEPDGDLSELYALADRQRFKQVLLNLVGNAIKYNRQVEKFFSVAKPSKAGWPYRCATPAPAFRPKRGNVFSRPLTVWAQNTAKSKAPDWVWRCRSACCTR